MPRVPLRIPPQGESAVADAIRKRRAPRDLIPLDGIVLHNEDVAAGYSSLMGAIRGKMDLPGDVRELLMLRVAARNKAVHEWVAHEKVGRSEGLTTAQLAVARDLCRPLPSPASPGPLSPLQAAALKYADTMTRDVSVPDHVFGALKSELAKSVGDEAKVDKLIVEATTTTAAYNMVSRLLVALHVSDDGDVPVPFPGAELQEVNVPVEDGVKLHVRVIKHADAKPWLVLINSILTNLSMWDIVVSSLSAHFNIVCYDQRGHGRSSIPPKPCTVEGLADDAAAIVSHLSIPTPVHAVIGVSQGGATALATAVRHPSLSSRVVACDTQANSPEANLGAWNERIEIAKSKGMAGLADVTLPRWFGQGSDLVSGRNERFVRDMIESTPVEGFELGARALQHFDLSADLPAALKDKKTLLLAGERDAKLPERFKELAATLEKQGVDVRCEIVPGSGHLPMVDQPEAFVKAVDGFLLQ